jgi:hypothetical protein
MKKIFLALLLLGIAAQVKADLNSKTSQWLGSHNIAVPGGLTSNQQTGLNWMVTPGCTAGAHTVGGIPVTCSGDKVADINNYLNMAVATNLYGAWAG